MKKSDPFIDAYREFRESVDFTRSGILPDRDHMISYLLMGVPRVPADDNPATESSMDAIDHRVLILKAVFTELNQNADEKFLDEGFTIYEQAGEKAKIIIRETEE